MPNAKMRTENHQSAFVLQSSYHNLSNKYNAIANTSAIPYRCTFTSCKLSYRF